MVLPHRVFEIRKRPAEDLKDRPRRSLAKSRISKNPKNNVLTNITKILG